jgi:hypothetical protein
VKTGIQLNYHRSLDTNASAVFNSPVENTREALQTTLSLPEPQKAPNMSIDYPEASFSLQPQCAKCSEDWGEYQGVFIDIDGENRKIA